MIIFLGFLFTILFAVAGQVMLKVGATSLNLEHGFSLQTVLNKYLLLGLLCFGSAFLCYTWLLRFVPLSVAHSIAAFQFVGVILASFIVLNEPMTLTRGVGILLISAGIFIVSYEYTQSAG